MRRNALSSGVSDRYLTVSFESTTGEIPAVAIRMFSWEKLCGIWGWAPQQIMDT